MVMGQAWDKRGLKRGFAGKDARATGFAGKDARATKDAPRDVI